MSTKLTSEWPLALILPAQTTLTLPWLWRTAPFTDEGLYIDAGHQVWAHWLHHAPLPDYASWFSGAPVLYPPLGAAADSIGGLPAARAESLIFMLVATAAVYFTGLRLFGRVPAFLGGVSFAVMGLVVHYGAFATYDAPALSFLALSMWTGVLARDGRTRWLVMCAACLVMSNAFKYATLAWDPVIAAIVFLSSCGRSKLRASTYVTSLALTVVILEGGLLLLGGPEYIRGVSVTTVFRTIHWGPSSTAQAVMWRAFALTGVILITAAVGVLLSIRREPLRVTLLLAVLTLAGLIAPFDQARIHQLASLDKNMGFGLIFPALAAGYAMSSAISRASSRWPAGRLVCGATAAAVVLLVLVAGRVQRVQFRGPSALMAHEVVAAVQKSYRAHTIIISPGASRTEKYYLPWIPASLWMGVFQPNAVTQAKFRQFVCDGRVSLVLMRTVDGKYDRAFDEKLSALIHQTGQYELIKRAGRGPYVMQIWRLEKPPGSQICA